MAKDALSAHARDKLGISETVTACRLLRASRRDQGKRLQADSIGLAQELRAF